MKPDLLKEIIQKIRSVKVIVIGDFCLDAYWFLDESGSEISVETGLPTSTVQTQKYSLGGAGNLVNNLISLKIKEVLAFGVIGNDLFGREMIDIMRKANINTDNILIQDEEWSTHVYCKPYLADEEQNRIDFGNLNILSEKTADQMMNALLVKINEVDAVIINQQVKSGIHTEYFRKKLFNLIKKIPNKIFITDSRDYNDSFEGTYLKMNEIEAALLCGFNDYSEKTVPYHDICEAAELLYKRYKKPVFITRGSHGSLVISSSVLKIIPGLFHNSRIDPVGAGDSYLAGLTVTLAAGYNPEIAAEIGSLAAGVTVRKLFQTGTATPDELYEIGKDTDYIYYPELAQDIRQAKYLNNSEIEIINNLPEDIYIRHAIFDHDGTISTLREGWESIMSPMMVKTILGNKYHSADEHLYQKVRSRVDEFIDRTTGIQTITQMAGLIELIREFGLVPEEEIQDVYSYKHIYNKELLCTVHKRQKKLKQEELSIDDFTIRNAVPFIKTLYKAGITLYLASGTDKNDVINEARILGYDQMFKGGIYGAVNDINREAKELVLEDIMKAIGVSAPGQIITFGDGPVEIRETRKRGGLTVGVASNEIRRFGLNETKRTRLIKAGADMIIPDFSQISQLLSLMNITIE